MTQKNDAFYVEGIREHIAAIKSYLPESLRELEHPDAYGDIALSAGSNQEAAALQRAAAVYSVDGTDLLHRLVTMDTLED